MSEIMIQATSSSAGKSFLATGLCRVFSEDGYRVAPFKSQNMSSKYYLTKEGYKISIAQALQAKAAGIEPTVDMNPVLLIPNSDTGSEVIVSGKSVGNMDALSYRDYRLRIKDLIKDSYERLKKTYDIIVIEGAGSPAEINLNDNDIVNMGLADLVDSPVILVGDIDRGGVFASLYGTVKLLSSKHQSRIKGLVINKFRGEKTLLLPGLEMIEELLNIPVIGTLPFLALDLADEDSLLDYKKLSNSKEQSEEDLQAELEKLSKMIRNNMDIDRLYKIMGLK